MLAPTTVHAVTSALAELFAYPQEGYFAKIEQCERLLAADCPRAASYIRQFRTEAEGHSVEELEELYTRTFDIAPLCVPYVTSYIWGDESFERGKLMSALAEAYARLGFDAQGELPDHIGVLLRFMSRLDEGETGDLIEYCLRAPLDEMVGRLESAQNIWGPALKAVRAYLEQTQGKAHD